MAREVLEKLQRIGLISERRGIVAITEIKVRVAYDIEVTMPPNTENVDSARKFAIAEAMLEFHRLLGDNPNKIYAGSKYLVTETWARRDKILAPIPSVSETISPLTGVNP